MHRTNDEEPHLLLRFKTILNTFVENDREINFGFTIAFSDSMLFIFMLYATYSFSHPSMYGEPLRNA